MVTDIKFYLLENLILYFMDLPENLIDDIYPTLSRFYLYEDFLSYMFIYFVLVMDFSSSM